MVLWGIDIIQYELASGFRDELSSTEANAAGINRLSCDSINDDFDKAPPADFQSHRGKMQVLLLGH